MPPYQKMLSICTSLVVPSVMLVSQSEQSPHFLSLNSCTIGVVSQPFCKDQLNPAGFNVPYMENYRFFPSRETGNLKINMAEADLSPTTFTSSSASDSDYDISLRIPLKMKTKICTLKLPVVIIIRPRKQCKS